MNGNLISRMITNDFHMGTWPFLRRAFFDVIDDPVVNANERLIFDVTVNVAYTNGGRYSVARQKLFDESMVSFFCRLADEIAPNIPATALTRWVFVHVRTHSVSRLLLSCLRSLRTF